MSLKKRTQEEIEDIIRDFGSGMSLIDVSKKHSIGEDAIYRIIQKSYGIDPDVNRKDQSKKKATRLEKQLKERDFEIRLLKAALKKYSGRKQE